jgi:site-specific DNA-methyltransferase (cytosine-N4-specific)
MNLHVSPPCPEHTRSFSLGDIDWNFSNRTPLSEIEGIHPYPARFIPEIPAALLDCLELKPGTAVLDPFVGSGTTLVECQRRGLPAIGVDLNPIACLISRVKTSTLPIGVDKALARVINSANNSRNINIPNIPNLDHWFSQEAQLVIANLVASINEAPPACQDILRVSLSSILVRVSNQESDTRYAAIDKNISSEYIYSIFQTAAHRTIKALAERTYFLSATKVIERNTLDLQIDEIGQKVGAIITSPPYPNAYEYWLYHKYRMWWLGHDPLSVKAQEIGARAHFFKTNPHTEEDFLCQMSKTFELISSVLIPDGYACFIVGRSKIHGKIIDNAKIIEDAASKFGFYTLSRTERVIAAGRKSFNLSHANIKTETILVLSR